MDKKGIWITLGTIGAVLVPIVIYSLVVSPRSSGQYDRLAQCLTQNGTKMYGAYWCAHCVNQKRLFGKSFDKINYIECSLPGGQEQTDVCKESGINSYPTWEFGDGSRVEGEVSLDTLAKKSNCEEVMK